MNQEFYDQKKWLDIHKQADDLIFTKEGRVLAALYKSPDERTRQDYQNFLCLLTGEKSSTGIAAAQKKSIIPSSLEAWMDENDREIIGRPEE